MENKNIWKKAEQSFVCAYDLSLDVLNGKLSVTEVEKKRLAELLKLWIDALERMIEHASDVEMAKDFQTYLQKLKVAEKEFEKKFSNN